MVLMEQDNEINRKTLIGASVKRKKKRRGSMLKDGHDK